MEPNKLIKLLRELKRDDVMVILTDEAIDSLIDIVEKHQKIQDIINNTEYIQEDVIRYQMICEVIESGNVD